MYMYLYYVYNVIYVEKATASAADLWAPRLGCLDAWMRVFVVACWQTWHQVGLHFGGLWSPVVSLGMVLASLWEHLDPTGSGRVPN